MEIGGDFYWSRSSLILGDSGYEMYLQDFRDGSMLTLDGPTGKHGFNCSRSSPAPDGFDSADGKKIFYVQWSFSSRTVETIGRIYLIDNVADLIVRYFKMRDERSLSLEGAIAKHCTSVVFL